MKSIIIIGIAALFSQIAFAGETSFRAGRIQATGVQSAGDLACDFSIYERPDMYPSFLVSLLDSRGNPIAGLGIYVENDEQLEQLSSARSNPNGRFTLSRSKDEVLTLDFEAGRLVSVTTHSAGTYQDQGRTVSFDQTFTCSALVKYFEN